MPAAGGGGAMASPRPRQPRPARGSARRKGPAKSDARRKDIYREAGARGVSPLVPPISQGRVSYAFEEFGHDLRTRADRRLQCRRRADRAAAQPRRNPAAASVAGDSELSGRGAGIYLIGAIVIGLLIWGGIEVLDDDETQQPVSLSKFKRRSGFPLRSAFFYPAVA